MLFIYAVLMTKWYELEVEDWPLYLCYRGDFEKDPNLTFYQAKQYAENRFECAEYKKQSKSKE
jgi:hypothetical protein